MLIFSRNHCILYVEKQCTGLWKRSGFFRVVHAFHSIQNQNTLQIHNLWIPILPESLPECFRSYPEMPNPNRSSVRSYCTPKSPWCDRFFQTATRCVYKEDSASYDRNTWRSAAASQLPYRASATSCFRAEPNSNPLRPP